MLGKSLLGIITAALGKGTKQGLLGMGQKPSA